MVNTENLEKALRQAWCYETCSPSLHEGWPNGNVAKGQCFVTALAAQDYLGGEVMELHLEGGEVHYYNLIEGCILDFTAEQFDFEIEDSFYDKGVPCNRENRLQDSVKQKRYGLYKERVDAIYETDSSK